MSFSIPAILAQVSRQPVPCPRRSLSRAGNHYSVGVARLTGGSFVALEAQRTRFPAGSFDAPMFRHPILGMGHRQTAVAVLTELLGVTLGACTGRRLGRVSVFLPPIAAVGDGHRVTMASLAEGLAVASVACCGRLACL